MILSKYTPIVLTLISKRTKESGKESVVHIGPSKSVSRKRSGACPDMYEAAKELAVKMEKYDRDREYISKSPVKITTEKANRVGKENVDEISATQEPIKVCRVKDQHPLNTERLNQMETSIVELLKAVQTLVEKKHALSLRRSSSSNLTLNRGNMNRNRTITSCTCFACNREGYMARDCPNRSEQSSNMDQSNMNSNTHANNPNVRGADIRLFEITEKTKPKEDEYLMICVSEDEALFNVRNLGKRRQ
ncbi:19088_t:CDS:1 [Gigaspora rosea]|nr:19088_t:CDS:1 [Gigaspora rosea]